jgi:hypothetical protein
VKLSEYLAQLDSYERQEIALVVGNRKLNDLEKRREINRIETWYEKQREAAEKKKHEFDK